jgi:ribonucleoside-diphosphate reductase alpha chain
MIGKVRKRDGRIVPFNSNKIQSAIEKAMVEAGQEDSKTAEYLSKNVVHTLNERKNSFHQGIPTIEQIQDVVEEILSKSQFDRVAKVYMLYRRSREKAREVKEFFKINDDMKFDVNAIRVLQERYLLRDEDGKIIETPTQLLKRVAKSTAATEKKDRQKWEEKFFDIMRSLEFLPNTPTLMNAGVEKGQLSACYVLPVEDSLVSIFDTLKTAALIQQTGGGTGFSFSRLRPRGDIVKSTKGVSSGPVSFIKIYDATTETVKQGGKRRGANMAILDVWHPDVLEFVTAKTPAKGLANFNVSVAADDEFMEAVEKNKDYDLVNPRTKKPVAKINARKLFDLICRNAWQTGDPGMIFIDEINRRHPANKVGKIEATNPCVTGDTLITTKKGLVPIKDLVESEYAEILTKDGDFRIAKVFKTGTKQVHRLTTKERHTLKLTEDHRVLTGRGWVQAKDLQAGDEISLSKSKGGFGNDGSLKKGRVLGWLIGDGHLSISDKRAALDFYGDEKQELAPKFAETLNKMFYPNNEKHIGMMQIQKRDMIRIRSQRLFNYAKQAGLAANKYQVPSMIFTGSEEFQRGFLQALFTADGSMQGNLEKGISVRLAQSNIELLNDVQKLLLNFGIASKIYANRRREQVKLMPDSKRNLKLYNVKAQHELIISKENIKTFSREIGFLMNYKQERLTSALKKMNREPYKESFTASFERLEKLGIEEVYDITEPVTHSFIANGIVVHNCGEVPLLPNEACNLGSINLGKFVSERKINFGKLAEVVKLATRFLDNVITANYYPTPEIDKVVKSNRKIGLGVMGFADMLIKLGIRYDSEEALKIADNVMKFISEEAIRESVRLGKEKGNFPNFRKSSWYGKYPSMRNATVTTIAPTGTIGIIAGCSTGIEPLFALAFMREVLEGKHLFEINNEFRKTLIKEGIYSDKLMEEIAKTGNLKNVKLPSDIKNLFRTALEIDPEWHIRMQAVFQKYTDNAVSKTINMPHNSTVEDVRKAYLLAYKLKCKGITIYRYGSKPTQVLYLGEGKKYSQATDEFFGTCIGGVCNF